MENNSEPDYSEIAKKLTKKIINTSTDYYLIDYHKDRDLYYSIPPEELKKNPLCMAGVCLNYIMDGELDKLQAVIDSIPDDNVPYEIQYLKLGLKIINPRITWKGFIDIIEYLKKTKTSIDNIVLTVGRPSILNGFNDFSRICPLLESRKKLFIEDLSCLYDKSLAPAIYNLCLSEWNYLKNCLIDAEILVSRTIKQFDKDSERRLLFAALYLQTKILIAQEKNPRPEAYIENIRKYVKEKGHAEFSYNIDAAQTLCSMLNGDTEKIVEWLKNDSPDEFSDFNMLDTWSYMVKLRAYIIVENYAAVIALVEKLRPLLEEGKRHMDMCEIDMLNAIALFRANQKEIAFKALYRSLKIAKRRQYYRIIADEGEGVLPVLNAFIKEKGIDSFGQEFFTLIIEEARKLSLKYPLYLKPKANTTSLTKMEKEILNLLERGKSTDEIAGYFLISNNTVKYHLKNLYTKLNVSNATGAVWEARLRGIL